MRILFYSILLLLNVIYTSAQHKNGNTQKPVELQTLENEVRKEIIENILPFWTNKMRDTINGGFYGRMDLNNQLYPDADKGGILNARILWTYSAAFRVLKDSAYLKIANELKKYIFNKFLDKEYGGTFLSVKSTGEVSDSRKLLYSQAFFIYALTENYRVTSDAEALEQAKAIFNCVEKYCADTNYNGYFEVYSRNWERINDLFIGENSDKNQKTMNTHLHLMEAYTNLYRVWPDKKVAERLQNLLELFISKIVDPQTNHLIVFMQENWERTSTIFSYGHDIESAWLLVEAAQVLGNKKIIGIVNDLSLRILEAASEALQPDGSIIYEKDFQTLHVNTERQWWPQAEAIVSLAYGYKLTGKREYLQKALKCWEYVDKYVVDHKNGEWFPVVLDNGIPSKNGDRAGFWKCPYHNGRMCLEIIELSEN